MKRILLVAVLALAGCGGTFNHVTASADKGKGQTVCTVYPVTVTGTAPATGQTHSTVVQVQDCTPGRNGK